jgi:hypothetical protein
MIHLGIQLPDGCNVRSGGHHACRRRRGVRGPKTSGLISPTAPASRARRGCATMVATDRRPLMIPLGIQLADGCNVRPGGHHACGRGVRGLKTSGSFRRPPQLHGPAVAARLWSPPTGRPLMIPLGRIQLADGCNVRPGGHHACRRGRGVRGLILCNCSRARGRVIGATN